MIVEESEVEKQRLPPVVHGIRGWGAGVDDVAGADLEIPLEEAGYVEPKGAAAFVFDAGAWQSRDGLKEHQGIGVVGDDNFAANR